MDMFLLTLEGCKKDRAFQYENIEYKVKRLTMHVLMLFCYKCLISV